MLNTEYHTYVHSAAGWGDIVRADSATGYSLPASVAAHVDFVSPTLRFPFARTGPTAMRANAPLRTNTPATLRQLYKVGHTEGNSTKNKQSCTAFLDQFYKPTDLTKFWTKCVLPAPARARASPLRSSSHFPPLALRARSAACPRHHPSRILFCDGHWISRASRGAVRLQCFRLACAAACPAALL